MTSPFEMSDSVSLPICNQRAAKKTVSPATDFAYYIGEGYLTETILEAILRWQE